LGRNGNLLLNKSFFTTKQLDFKKMFRQVVRSSIRNASEASSGMKFSFASARQEHYTNATNVTQVDLPTGTGMMGILPNHVPTLGVLASGWASVYEPSGVKKFFVSSGSYTVMADGTVNIAAEEAIPEAEICLDACRQALNELKSEGAAASTEAEKNDVQIATETLEAMLR